jgi:MoxR-like ATPase
MDHRKFVELDNGEIIKVHPNFRLFATMNPGYEGTSMLNLALYDRFDIKLYVGELEAKSIKGFIQSTYNTSDEDFDIMLSVYNAVKSKIVQEERDEVIAPDIMKNWAREIANGFSVIEAAEITIYNISLDDRDFRKWIEKVVSSIVKKAAM